MAKTKPNCAKSITSRREIRHYPAKGVNLKNHKF